MVFQRNIVPSSSRVKACKETSQSQETRFVSGFTTANLIILLFRTQVGWDSSVGSGSLRTGRSGDHPGGAKFSVPVQTGCGAHSASYIMGTRSFLGVKWPGCGVDYPPHLEPGLRKE